MFMYLEHLFDYLKFNGFQGRIDLSFDRINGIIGKELCDSAKRSTWYWNSPTIKNLKHLYRIEVIEVNQVAEYIRFNIL